MIAYLAVISDSFRAAFTSRVLWIAFVVIWILLAALAPVGFRQEYTTVFSSQDFYNGTRLKAILAQGTVDESVADRPIGRLAAAMPQELSRQLRRVGEGDEVRIYLRVFADALNQCLDDESWYSEAAWADALQFRELRELESLSEPIDEGLRRRRARLRIEAALPGVFETRSSRSIRLTYAGIDFPARFAMDKPQFLIVINQYVLPVIIQWLMGFILVFLGILVTSSMIPEMLQPGSLHLLLSKPVSRSLLLLSKFLGGCTFVLLCVTQLVIGLFLIAWLRLDIFNARMLWCIPVSVFLFSVFYSVSTFAGLIWRSSILSIGVTCVFGSVCLVVGVIGGLFDSFVTRPASIRHLATVGDHLIATTRGGGLVRWDDGEQVWNEIIESNSLGADRVLPPVAVNESTVITSRVRGGRFNPFGSGASDILVLNEGSSWVGEPSLRLPTSTTEIFLAGDRIIALNAGELASASVQQVLSEAGERVPDEDHQEGGASDLSSTTGASEEAEEGPGGSSADPKSSGWLQKLSTMMGGVTEGFQEVLPRNVSLSPPRSVFVDKSGAFLVVYSRDRLMRFEPPNAGVGIWESVAEYAMDGDASKPSWLAVSGETVLLAREEKGLELFDARTLEPLSSAELPEAVTPVLLVGIPDRQEYLLSSSDGRLRQVTISTDNQSISISNPIGPSEVECVYVDPAVSQAYIAHHIDRLEVYDITDWSIVERRNPVLEGWRFVDRYIISPLRFITPQTGELGDTIESIISGKTTKTILDGPEAGEVIRYKLARPIVSCSAFIILMLFTSCYYFTTRDF